MLHSLMIQNENYHPLALQILKARGFTDSMIAEHLSSDLKAMPDLTQMQDMQKAAERLVKALKSNEKIGIYGDYDVDGTTSCALLGQFFRMLGHEVFLLQPGRFIEGYGVHLSSIDKAIEENVKVLVTVDCGITNVETAVYAQGKNIDLIITDHHTDAREVLPPAFAVVNPNRRDEPKNSPLGALAGVGVAFALAWAIKKELEKRGEKIPSLYPLLQFVAIGTICDVAKLTPINLKLVRHGLKQMKETQYPGIKVFLNNDDFAAGLLPAEKLSFHIGPMINSKGRLDHPEMALLLLMSTDSQEAFNYYSHLEISNKERKRIQAEVYKAAKAQIIAHFKEGDHPISIAYAPDWHEGVIGIVASKLVEDFNAPAVVFTDSEHPGIIKGSARSCGDLNIFECLKMSEGLYSKFGGHKAAAGLSMPKANLAPFCEEMKKNVGKRPLTERSESLTFDLHLPSEEITPQLAKSLEMIGPFGEGNPRPTFKCTDLELASFDLLKDVHARWNFVSKNKMRLKGISFNYVGKWNKASPQDVQKASLAGQRLNTYFQLSINRFKGNEFLQLEVEHLDV